MGGNVSRVVGVSGGHVGTSYAVGTVHGDVGKTENKYYMGTATNPRKRTKEEIKHLTFGMIHVSAVDTVVDMLKRGRNWVTITGNAGDGKTTLGYLVLKKLQKKMRVYRIEEPEEYRLLSKFNEKRVIMFDDRFGAFTSDHVLIDKWKNVIEDIHRRFSMNRTETKVLFISRKNVVNEARDYLRHFQDTIFCDENVVDLSSVKIIDERLKILDHHLKLSKLKVNTEVKNRVAEIDIAHGFPHCSRMYSKLKTEKHDLDIEEFFKTPLKFLDITTAYLYNDNCKDLFELMIKNNGQFDAYSLEDRERRISLLKVERDQEGSYITVWKNGVCVFAHPSIYESVVSIICNTDPLFCVQHATLSVIRQKLTLTSDEKQKLPTTINVKHILPVLKILSERFQPEILEGDYSIFGHRFCDDEDFCKELLDTCVYSDDAGQVETKKHIDSLGKEGGTMLWTSIVGGKKPAILALVDHGADVNIPDDSGHTPLMYLCKQETVDTESIRMVIGLNADCNVKDETGNTALLYLCKQRNIERELIQEMVTKADTDCVGVRDETGNTALLYMCKQNNISPELVKELVIRGSSDCTNTNDECGLTALHYICGRKKVNIQLVQFMLSQVRSDINQGDASGASPLHWLSGNSSVSVDDIEQLTAEGRGDINKQDEFGFTCLHYLCTRNVKIRSLVRLIKKEAGNINQTDMFGSTPLLYMSATNKQGVDHLLENISEADTQLQNADGYTPQDFLDGRANESQLSVTPILDKPLPYLLMTLTHEEKLIPVIGPAMTLETKRVHREVQVVDGLELNNMEKSGDTDRPGHFLNFWGTCSRPVPVPASPSPFYLPSYWETHNTLTWKKRVGWLLQMGVVVGRGNLDKEFCVSCLPNSLCVTVMDECHLHRGRLCIQVLRRRDQEVSRHQVGECVTLSRPTSGDKLSFKFGLLLDVRRGRVALIDVERGKLLCKVNVKFTELVFPMFYVVPVSDWCATRMRLVSGREISITDQKIDLIQQALFD